MRVILTMTATALVLLAAALPGAARADLFSTINTVVDQTKTNLSNAAEKAEETGKRIEHQTKVNAANLEENVKDNTKRVGEQTETNLEHLRDRVKRDAKNFVRWIREDECDREGRKNGPEAKKRCEAENKARQLAGTSPGAPYQYFASIELDCYRRGYPNDLWGNEIIRVWSTVSKSDARSQAQRHAQAGNVCAKAFGFDELVDGAWRWLSE